MLCSLSSSTCLYTVYKRTPLKYLDVSDNPTQQTHNDNDDDPGVSELDSRKKQSIGVIYGCIHLHTTRAQAVRCHANAFRGSATTRVHTGVRTPQVAHESIQQSMNHMWRIT